MRHLQLPHSIHNHPHYPRPHITRPTRKMLNFAKQNTFPSAVQMRGRGVELLVAESRGRSDVRRAEPSEKWRLVGIAARWWGRSPGRVRSASAALKRSSWGHCRRGRSYDPIGRLATRPRLLSQGTRYHRPTQPGHVFARRACAPRPSLFTKKRTHSSHRPYNVLPSTKAENRRARCASSIVRSKVRQAPEPRNQSHMYRGFRRTKGARSEGTRGK